MLVTNPQVAQAQYVTFDSIDKRVKHFVWGIPFSRPKYVK